MDTQYWRRIYGDMLIGKLPENKLYIPKKQNEEIALEMFRCALEWYLHWTPEYFLSHCSKRILDMMKLSCLLRRRCISGISTDNLTDEMKMRIMAKCYPEKFRYKPENIIEIYKRVRENKKIGQSPSKINGKYFDGSDGLKNLKNLFYYFLSVYISPYLDDDSLSYNNDLYKLFSDNVFITQLLSKAGLKAIYYNRYKTGLNALNNLLPSEEEGVTMCSNRIYKSSSLYSFWKFQQAYGKTRSSHPA